MVVRDGQWSTWKGPFPTDVAVSDKSRETRCLMAAEGLNVEVTPRGKGRGGQGVLRVMGQPMVVERDRTVGQRMVVQRHDGGPAVNVAAAWSEQPSYTQRGTAASQPASCQPVYIQQQQQQPWYNSSSYSYTGIRCDMTAYSHLNPHTSPAHTSLPWQPPTPHQAC